MTENTEKLRSFAEEYNLSSDEKIVVRENEPLSLHSSFRIGGNADLFLIPTGEKSLTELTKMIKQTSERVYFLGNGTNILFSDDGYRGTVVSLGGLRNVSVDGDEISAGAGVPLITVCKAARDSSLAGMEFAYGIPGSVGGAVYMNAGAYGGMTADILKESTYIDLNDFSLKTIPLEEHDFGYRDSVYKHTDRVIVSAKFSLQKGDKDVISAQMNDIMARRVDKQPLEYPSAGSVFKRPEGHFAGQLIEESGLKGYSVGGAQVSEKHAGFIINKGGATAGDVLGLIEHIREVVNKNYGILLECEIIYVKP